MAESCVAQASRGRAVSHDFCVTSVTQIGDGLHYRSGLRVRSMEASRQKELAMSNAHRRLATTVLAPAAALAAWAAFRLGGVDYKLKSGDTVGALDVVTTALMGAVVGWLVLHAIERRSLRPRATWMLVATTALAVSIVGPMWFADGGSAVALITLHVVTAVVVIVGLAGTVPVRRPAGDGDRAPAVARGVTG
jgi:hypothetical protein